LLLLLGVVSDTHDNIFSTERIVRELLDHGVNAIIHLGDIVSPFTVKMMKNLVGDVKVIAVKGNNDGDVYLLTTLFRNYGWFFSQEPLIYEIDGRRLFLLHGMSDASFTVEVARALAKSLRVDAVLYGHTHQPHQENVNGVVLFNPGEGCGYLTGKVSYGVVDTASMETKIYYL